MGSRLVHREGLLGCALRMARSYGHDAIAGQNLAQLTERTQHGCWNAFVGASALELFLPLLLEPFDMAQIRSPGFARLTCLFIRNSSEDIGQDKLAIGRNAHLRGIILADFARIDIDLDELGVRD